MTLEFSEEELLKIANEALEESWLEYQVDQRMRADSLDLAISMEARLDGCENDVVACLAAGVRLAAHFTMSGFDGMLTYAAIMGSAEEAESTTDFEVLSPCYLYTHSGLQFMSGLCILVGELVRTASKRGVDLNDVLNGVLQYKRAGVTDGTCLPGDWLPNHPIPPSAESGYWQNPDDDGMNPVPIWG